MQPAIHAIWRSARGAGKSSRLRSKPSRHRGGLASRLQHDVADCATAHGCDHRTRTAQAPRPLPFFRVRRFFSGLFPACLGFFFPLMPAGLPPGLAAAPLTGLRPGRCAALPLCPPRDPGPSGPSPTSGLRGRGVGLSAPFRPTPCLADSDLGLPGAVSSAAPTTAEPGLLRRSIASLC